MASFNTPTKNRSTEALLESLNLSTPAVLRDKTQSELAASNLTGYEAMRRIRDDAAQFRRDYSNWRKGGAQGAKGARGIKTDKGSNEYLKMAHNPLSEMTTAKKSWPLRRENLGKIGAVGELRVPTAAPKPTAFMAHLGVGGFHRSHQAYVTDVLLERAATRTVPTGFDDARRISYQQLGPGSGGQLDAGADDVWGILGVGLMPWDVKMYETLKKQDYMYTLLTRGTDGSAARVIQSIVDFLHVPEDPEKVLQRLCQPDVRIVSLTVTEKGYYRTADGHLDETNPLVAEDIKAWTANGLKQPKTALGLICTIAHRRKDAAGPFTVLSCDNLPMNGLTCKTATLEFAAKVDPALAAYLEREIPFPSSMVDRITPVTKPEQIELLKDEYGVEDGWPVVAEPFLQWVVEDKFAAGRPKWEQAASGLNESVLFVEDVEPYELMKLRLLNSSHSAMAYVSLLGGHVFVDEALGDIDVLTFLRAYMAEIVTTLVPVAGVDFIQYRAKLVERFSNPYIKDTLERLAQDGSQKFFATLGEALVKHFKGQSRAKFDVLAVAFAAFLRCCATEPGEADPRAAKYDEAMVAPAPPMELVDPKLVTLSPLATAALDAVVDEHLAAQSLDVDAADDARRPSGNRLRDARDGRMREEAGTSIPTPRKGWH